MSGARVSIPNNVRKTIQNIKEITGNHSEDEIYAMLKECSMDPNETTQKLLLQDPFHEVKRKRDRKKENLNKEITEPKWKTGMQGRGNRGGRGSYPSRHISNVGGRTSFSAKENGVNQGQKNKETFVDASSSSSKLSGPLPQIPTEANKGPTILLGSGTTRGSHATSASKIPSPSPGVGLSDSDPILMPSTDSQLLAGTIRREVGSQQTTVDQIHETPTEGNLNSSGKVPVEVQGIGKNLLLEPSHVSVSNKRPSSNYNNRPQQAIGPQKVGPTMEWKPKPTNPILAQDSESIESTKVPVIPVESQSQSQNQTPTLSASTNLDPNITPRELIKKLEDSHISDNQHVIIPNHLHVPEAEKLGFCFGSFDASFGLNLGSLNGPEPVSDKSSIASEVVDESIEDQQPRNQDASSTVDQGDDPERPTSSNNKPENLSVENADSSNAGHHHQYPVVHTSPNFNLGFMPPMIGTHLNESQYPLAQQPIDPASYYAQFYRSGADADGRVSPFHSPNKFNGNIPILPLQASQSSQEVGTNPTPITTTQTGGIIQTSIPVTQQPIPVFRQLTGVHLPNYPPNYIPYFSPYYVPQPTIHQFLSNGGAFSQHPQIGYSGPPVANPNPKYPVPQYKPAGHYGSNPEVFNNPGSGTAAASSGSNDDHGGSRFNESNVYITGQQSEGSDVWVGPPGRDISGLQPNSFYNMGQGPIANIYHHPAQPLLQQHSQTLGGPGSDMAGPTPQVNWPNNY